MIGIKTYCQESHFVQCTKWFSRHFFWSALVITVHFPVGTARSKIVTLKKQVCLLWETMGNIRVRNLLCHILTVLFPVALGKSSLIEHKVIENFDIMSPEEVQ